MIETISKKEDITIKLSKYKSIGFDFDDVLHNGYYDQEFIKFILKNSEKRFVIITNRPNRYYDMTMLEIKKAFLTLCNTHVEPFDIFSNIVMSPDQYLTGSDAVNEFKAKASLQCNIDVMIDDDMLHEIGFEKTNINFIHVQLPIKISTTYGGWYY